jgi:hypothetical protein
MRRSLHRSRGGWPRSGGLAAAVASRVLAVFALLATASSSFAVSALPPHVEEALDAVLACERKGGGFMYVCKQGVRVWGATSVVNVAERVGGAFGLADWDVVVLRSPGTSTAGELLLDAHRRSGRPDLLAAARRAGDLVVNLQLPNGGWFSEVPVRGDRAATWFLAIAPWATLDDDVTSGAVRFLLALWQRTGEGRYREAAERGVDLLVDSQLDDGAWPLTWRPRLRRWLSPSFEDLPSLNDAATTAVIETLVIAARALDRPELLGPARRGADWLLSVRHGLPGWAQQYSMNGEPVAGRAFEPIALATWETRHALEALDAVAAATGDRKYCEPFATTLDWLAREELRPRCWARFYSLDEGGPIFLDRRGNPVADPRRAKRPYRWTGDFGIPYLRLRIAAATADGASSAGVANPPSSAATASGASSATAVSGASSAAAVSGASSAPAVSDLPSTGVAKGPSSAGSAPFRVAGDSGFCPGEYRYDFPRVDSPSPRVRLGMLATRLAALDAPAPLFCAAPSHEHGAKVAMRGGPR